MAARRDQDFGGFMEKNRVVVDDSVFEFDEAKYDKMLEERPWQKE